MQEPILSLHGISYSYHSLSGEIPALRDVTFAVKNGEFLALVGPSGCGKSTLFHIISNLAQPEQGVISFHNPDGSLRYPRIGYMLQRDHLLPWRSVWKNVTLGLEIRHQLTPAHQAQAQKLLQDYGLEPFRDKKPGELSGGMRQRAALIRTLVLDPEILLLDEPFSALDYQTRLTVSADICRIIRERGKTAILITHDLAEAVSLADRVLVLSARPATVRADIPIHLTRGAASPIAARQAPEFASYLNQLWKELAYENEVQNEAKTAVF